MNQRINRISRRGFMGIATAALIVACGQTQEAQQTPTEETDAGKIGGQVNIYSSRHYNTDDALYDG